MRESQIEKYLADRVKKAGGISFKWVSPNARGVPDRIVLLPGATLCFVETKAPRGILGALQYFQHKKIRALGFRVEVVRSKPQADALIANLTGEDRGLVSANVLANED